MQLKIDILELHFPRKIQIWKLSTFHDVIWAQFTKSFKIF